jgi:tetratricopeptide (TPR) repeat protein
VVEREPSKLGVAGSNPVSRSSLISSERKVSRAAGPRTVHRLITGTGMLRLCSWALSLSLIAVAVPLAAQDVASHNRRGVELNAEGRHTEAIAEFEKALRLAPSQPVVRRNLALAHAGFGAVLLQKRAFEAAAVQYEAAIALLPEEAEFHMGLGWAFLGLQEPDRAVEALRRARNLNPNEVRVYRLLGEAYYHRGDMAAAVMAWEEGLRLRPGDQELEGLVTKAEGERRVYEEYERRPGHHFTLRYVGEVQEELGKEILAILERAYEEVGYNLNHYPRHEVQVVVYSDEDFVAVTDLPSWVGGVFDERGGRIRIPVRGIQQTVDLRALLYHEYTHVVIRGVTGGRVPTWLNEGLALIEQRSAMDGEVEMVRQLAVKGELPSLGTLNDSFVGLSSSDARVNYAVSYVATRYLADRWSLWDIQRLLHRLGDGVPFDGALEEVTRLTLADFEQEWRESLIKGN